MSTGNASERSDGSESDAYVSWYVVIGILKVPVTGSTPSRPEFVNLGSRLVNAKRPHKFAVKPPLLPLLCTCSVTELWRVAVMKRVIILGCGGMSTSLQLSLVTSSCEGGVQAVPRGTFLPRNIRAHGTV